MNSQNFQLPYRGINRGMAVCVTPSEYTTNMLNIRPIDVLEKKLRLGKRPGLVKWDDIQIGDLENPVVAICSVSTVQ